MEQIESKRGFILSFFVLKKCISIYAALLLIFLQE